MLLLPWLRRVETSISLLITQNISIVYADVFKYPTVRELAAIVDDQASDQSGQSNNEFAGYNYNKIQSVISGNVEENVDRITREKLGDIMITGATGFLGIHILKAYLDNYDGKVYCLVRKGAYESMEKRMMHMLMYYFDNPCEELFKDRIVCVDGDITSKEQVESFAAYKFQINFITTVFHACNSHHIYMADLIYAMRKYGFKLDIVKDEEFEEAVKEFAKNSNDSDAVSGLIAYTSHNENEIYAMEYSNRFTAQALYRLEYKWPVTDDRYLESAIGALDRLAFFD